MKMKTVLCYGDSLTWGYDPVSGSRHVMADRWPSSLVAALGGRAETVCEGLNGRTTAFDDHLADCDRNGARVLPTVLHSHAPVDLVILMLGTNDMKPFVAGRAVGAVQGMRRLIDLVQSHVWPCEMPSPGILVVAPPPLCETDDPDFAASFSGGVTQSAMLAPLYDELAEQTGCGFFDAGSVVRTSPVDGVHLDAESMAALGRALAPTVKELLGPL
jgi:lysophospholipase L1-like esterase